MSPASRERIEIVIGSRNPGKLVEIEAILQNFPVKLRSLAEFPNAPDVEETGTTFQENAEKKALELAAHLARKVLADDSGLEVDALDGAPGIYSARYAGEHGDNEANNRKLLENLEGLPLEQRTARFRCVIALAEPGRVLLTADGACEGQIAFSPRGTNGFGYDPVFLYPPDNMTFGELNESLKNKVSHRANALRQLKEQLKDIFNQ